MKFAIVMMLIAVSQCFLKLKADQCHADVQAVIAGGQKVVEDVLSLNWKAATADLKALVPLAKQTLADCDSDIPAACKADVQKAEDIVKAIVADVEAKNIQAAAADVQKLIPVVIQAKADCLPQEAFDDVCMSDINALVPGVQNVVADLLAKKWSDAEQAVIALEPLAAKTVEDCLLSAACKNDISSATTLIKSLVADVKAKDWFKAIEDGKNLLPVAMSLKADCFAKKTVFKGIDMTCIGDIAAVLEDLETVVSDVESFNIVGAIAAAEQVVPLGKKAIADCTAPSAYQAINAACVNDVTGILKDIGQIVLDVEKKDWSNVFVQAAAIVKSGIAFKADCL